MMTENMVFLICGTVFFCCFPAYYGLKRYLEHREIMDGKREATYPRTYYDAAHDEGLEKAAILSEKYASMGFAAEIRKLKSDAEEEND
jgi:hypothetical protein